MVRFSDMLGGSGEPDDANAPESVYAALANDAADAEPEVEEDESDGAADADGPKEPVPMATFETPEPVVEAHPEIEAEVEVEVESEGLLPPVGDDFLPSFEGLDRKPGRGRKRH